MGLFFSVLMQFRYPVYQQMIQQSQSCFLPALHAFHFQEEFRPTVDDIFEIRRRIIKAKAKLKQVVEVKGGEIQPVFRRIENFANIKRSRIRTLYNRFELWAKHMAIAGESTRDFLAAFKKNKMKHKVSDGWREMMEMYPRCGLVLRDLVLMGLVESLDIGELYREFCELMAKIFGCMVKDKGLTWVRGMTRVDVLEYLNCNRNKFKGSMFSYGGLMRRLTGFLEVTRELRMTDISEEVRKGLEELETARKHLEREDMIGRFDIRVVTNSIEELKERMARLRDRSSGEGAKVSTEEATRMSQTVEEAAD